MSNPTQIKVQLQSTCIAPQIHGTENLWKRTSACHLTAPPVCRMCCSVRTLLAGNLHAPRTWHHKQFIFLCTFLSFMVPILIVQPWHEAAGAAVLHCRSAKMWKEKKRIQPVTNVKEKGAFVPKKENIRREASAFLSPWSKRKKYRTKKSCTEDKIYSPTLPHRHDVAQVCFLSLATPGRSAGGDLDSVLCNGTQLPMHMPFLCWQSWQWWCAGG